MRCLEIVVLIIAAPAIVLYVFAAVLAIRILYDLITI